MKVFLSLVSLTIILAIWTISYMVNILAESKTDFPEVTYVETYESPKAKAFNDLF